MFLYLENESIFAYSTPSLLAAAAQLQEGQKSALNSSQQQIPTFADAFTQCSLAIDVYMYVWTQIQCAK